MPRSRRTKSIPSERCTRNIRRRRSFRNSPSLEVRNPGGTMDIRKPTFAFVLAAFAALSIARLTATDSGGENFRLSGCLVRGETGGDRLTHGANQPSWQRADHSVTPGAVGTTGSVATIFYWLRDDDDLKPHVGHRVEVTGQLKGEGAEGQIKIDRKDKWTEVEIKADGDTMKARLHHMSVVPVGDGDRQVPVVVRKVDVDKVSMVAANCN